MNDLGVLHIDDSQLGAEGIEIGLISWQLWHRLIAKIAHYVNHIAPLDLINAMRASKWC